MAIHPTVTLATPLPGALPQPYKSHPDDPRSTPHLTVPFSSPLPRRKPSPPSFPRPLRATAVARSPRRRPSPGEALVELPVRSSLCCGPAGELCCTGAAGSRAPVSAPPRPGPPSVHAAVGPRWTERARPVHGCVDPVYNFIR
jgi:hypothetical protein